MLISARIIDANLNRSREALRTMEDISRFALGDSAATENLKSIRHSLGELDQHLPIDKGTRVAARNVESDVGTAISTPQEMARSGILEISIAAAARLQESLRSIEEQCKTLADGGPSAKRAEALRYRAYVAEQQLLLMLGTRRARQWRLCIIVSEDVCTHLPWEKVVERAIAGGADCIQLREKRLTERDMLRRAKRLVEICRTHRATSIINDRPDLAVLAGADGVHIGQTDLHVRDVRKLVGFNLLIGISTSNIEIAREAAEAGADYMGVGPMFPSSTKPKDDLSGPEYLREYLADPITSRVPHLAISGINLASIPLLIAAGAKGIAVSSAVCKQESPEIAARQLLEALAPTGLEPVATVA